MNCAGPLEAGGHPTVLADVIVARTITDERAWKSLGDLRNMLSKASAGGSSNAARAAQVYYTQVSAAISNSVVEGRTGVVEVSVRALGRHGFQWRGSVFMRTRNRTPVVVNSNAIVVEVFMAGWCHAQHVFFAGINALHTMPTGAPGCDTSDPTHFFEDARKIIEYITAQWGDGVSADVSCWPNKIAELFPQAAAGFVSACIGFEKLTAYLRASALVSREYAGWRQPTNDAMIDAINHSHVAFACANDFTQKCTYAYNSPLSDLAEVMRGATMALYVREVGIKWARASCASGENMGGTDRTSRMEWSIHALRVSYRIGLHVNSLWASKPHMRSHEPLDSVISHIVVDNLLNSQYIDAIIGQVTGALRVYVPSTPQNEMRLSDNATQLMAPALLLNIIDQTRAQ